MTTVRIGPLKVIKAVIFDVGETLLDDTRECGEWADWLGVRRNTFTAVRGAVEGSYRDVFQVFRPGFIMAAEYDARARAGRPQRIEEQDIYEDVRSALKALRDMGLWVGVAGNQAPQVGDLLRALDLPVDEIATSAEWGAAKPHQEFFDRVAAMAPCERHEILYVGDHVENDVRAAHRAGMRAALIRRGPWGWLAFDKPELVAEADLAVRSLLELPELLESRNPESRSAELLDDLAEDHAQVAFAEDTH
jgi:HAD superfamily hydrolase (TIGR01549 family)